MGGLAEIAVIIVEATVKLVVVDIDDSIDDDEINIKNRTEEQVSIKFVSMTIKRIQVGLRGLLLITKIQDSSYGTNLGVSNIFGNNLLIF